MPSIIAAGSLEIQPNEVRKSSSCVTGQKDKFVCVTGSKVKFVCNGVKGSSSCVTGQKVKFVYVTGSKRQVRV